ncbi:sortase B protein-sorting domain-containing protein [Catenibacterium sp. AM22-15]|uniref:sortase B protein-sorting domain-containing protein n=1 Tax=unclassified Catenibacterium TaxID=2643636 RepID=UPI000E3EFE89|nr:MULTISPECIES: sortase B protein-sorting domain-containing protein [unclassified Catenibacterium]RGE96974.1 sortase B protein-sorting domain-containing protein [Catenibacterium sp. AM22-6LB]RGE98516.1 sortase B protein-sorting domain-containing protein [Catenibacterium sp. AM22-15]
MNKKLMTMLVACALSVTTLSTTAVFAEDAVVTGETPAVTETTTTPETTPAAYEPEVTLLTPKSKWTGDSDIVFEVDAKGGTVSNGEMYVYDANGYGEPLYCVESTKEVNEQGKGKITFTKDALKNAETWTWKDDDEVENKTTVDWTKYSKIEFVFGFELNGQYQSKSMYVETSVKAPEITVTPTTPSQPAKPTTPTKPAKPAENKGTTTTTTTTTKKEAPKTGDTMNVALYASLLLVSALAAVVLTTKKRINE